MDQLLMMVRRVIYLSIYTVHPLGIFGTSHRPPFNPALEHQALYRSVLLGC
jgi:hypothetical protein